MTDLNEAKLHRHDAPLLIRREPTFTSPDLRREPTHNRHAVLWLHGSAARQQRPVRLATARPAAMAPGMVGPHPLILVEACSPAHSIGLPERPVRRPRGDAGSHEERASGRILPGVCSAPIQSHEKAKHVGVQQEDVVIEL
jgi:hypothetical protein